MFRRIDDFLTDWQHENTATLRVLRALTDESLSYVAPGVRPIGRLAWHIAETLTEMMNHAGLPVGDVPASVVPSSAAAIVEEYQRAAQIVAQAVRENWTDEMLDAGEHVWAGVGARSRALHPHQARGAPPWPVDGAHASGGSRRARLLRTRARGVGGDGRAGDGVRQRGRRSGTGD